MHLKARDIDKEVSISDFNATAYKTKNGTSVFFFTFPDCDFIDGSSKYVAFAWAPQRPMYFTLEYSEHALDNHKPCWVFGEFFVKDSRQQHNNYGTIDDIGLKEFVSLVLEKLDSQNI